jgi:tetratricopeptide (TPR) repeat protein
MRISRITDRDNSIFDDKAFVQKFTLLLGLIIAISLFLIYHSLHQVSDFSLSSLTHFKEKPLSLGSVEEELNGNVISLNVLENDPVDDLVEKDLQQLQALEQSAASKYASEAVAAVQSKQETKKHTIQITSVEIRHRAPKAKSLKWLKKKFYTTNNIKYALNIAKKYYFAKKYDKALKWSLIANEVDQRNVESWIMFAKTKMKMGKKQDAINVLNAYLKTYSSPKISKYLQKIKSS